jgi:DNA-binding CsgD family transcriptional regulator
LALEKSSNELAQHLFLSTFTVNTHRKNILQKLGLKNSAGLIKFASDNSLI